MIEKYEFVIAIILVILLVLVAWLSNFNGPVIIGSGIIMMIVQWFIVRHLKKRQ